MYTNSNQHTPIINFIITIFLYRTTHGFANRGPNYERRANRGRRPNL